MIFYTSDTHFYDADMLKYEPQNDRSVPHFRNVEERNETIITNWNRTVTSNDDVYIAGDVSLAGRTQTEQVLRRLNGRKHIILGNHDGGYFRSLLRSRCDVVEVSDGIIRIRDTGRDVVICHYPIFAWEKQHKGSYLVYGHLHATRENALYQQAGKEFIRQVGMSEFRAMNAGTMLNHYMPMTLNQLCIKSNLGRAWSDITGPDEMD